MTTINEYLNRDKPDEPVEVKSLEDAKKLYPEIKDWMTLAQVVEYIKQKALK